MPREIESKTNSYAGLFPWLLGARKLKSGYNFVVRCRPEIKQSSQDKWKNLILGFLSNNFSKQKQEMYIAIELSF